ncbi:hypothetical protein KGY47_03515 [Candidatus Bipolaricaulota bacterium]|nr:hypothetical protein [Candidatus Bipolaricaulota bacterium]
MSFGYKPCQQVDDRRREVGPYLPDAQIAAVARANDLTVLSEDKHF